MEGAHSAHFFCLVVRAALPPPRRRMRFWGFYLEPPPAAAGAFCLQERRLCLSKNVQLFGKVIRLSKKICFYQTLNLKTEKSNLITEDLARPQKWIGRFN